MDRILFILYFNLEIYVDIEVFVFLFNFQPYGKRKKINEYRNISYLHHVKTYIVE